MFSSWKAKCLGEGWLDGGIVRRVCLVVILIVMGRIVTHDLEVY